MTLSALILHHTAVSKTIGCSLPQRILHRVQCWSCNAILHLYCIYTASILHLYCIYTASVLHLYCIYTAYNARQAVPCK
jgi:hypothetical protein